MPRLLLVRHGATEDNVLRRFLGQRDVPLSRLGREQVERLRLRLTGERIDAAYTSDLSRARDTAMPVCAGRAEALVACPELREMDFGDCDGLTFDEIVERYPRLARSVGGGKRIEFPGGETLQQLNDRVGLFLARLGQHGAGESVLVVSHGGPLRVALCRLLGIGLGHWWQFRLDTASLTVVGMYPAGAVVTLMNDTSHLTTGPETRGAT